jgi:hypothetical protein
MLGKEGQTLVPDAPQASLYKVVCLDLNWFPVTLLVILNPLHESIDRIFLDGIYAVLYDLPTLKMAGIPQLLLIEEKQVFFKWLLRRLLRGRLLLRTRCADQLIHR